MADNNGIIKEKSHEQYTRQKSTTINTHMEKYTLEENDYNGTSLQFTHTSGRAR